MVNSLLFLPVTLLNGENDVKHRSHAHSCCYEGNIVAGGNCSTRVVGSIGATCFHSDGNLAHATRLLQPTPNNIRNMTLDGKYVRCVCSMTYVRLTRLVLDAQGNEYVHGLERGRSSFSTAIIFQVRVQKGRSRSRRTIAKQCKFGP